MNLEIKTHGISTSLYNSSLVNENTNSLITPIGSSLSKWDIDTMERQKIIQSNSNAIVLLLKNANYVFSIADDGEIIILNHELGQYYQLFKFIYNQIIDQYFLDILFSSHDLSNQKVRHASVNDQYLSISYQQNDHFSGKTVCYDIKNIYQMKKILEINANHTVNQLNFKDNMLLLVKETILQNIESQNLYSNELQLYNLDNLSSTYEKIKVLDTIDSISTYKSNLNDTISLIFLYREIIVINLQTLEIKYQGRIDGKGNISSVHMKGNKLILCPNINIILKIQFDAVEPLPKLILQKNNQNSSIEQLEFNSSAISDKKNFIYLFENENQFLSVAETSISKIDLTKNITQRINFSNISLCGLASNQDGSLIASGDLGGQIYIFDNKISINYLPLYQQSILYPSMVRSLAWSPLSNSVFIGDFSGNIYKYLIIIYKILFYFE